MGEEVGLWLSMAVAVSIDFSSMAWRSLARPRCDALVSCEGSLALSRRWSPPGKDRKSDREHAILFAREVEA